MIDVEAILSLQNGFTWLKINYEKASSLLMGIFGPKFDPAFPKQIRACETGCDCGVFPSTGGANNQVGICRHDVTCTLAVRTLRPI